MYVSLRMFFFFFFKQKTAFELRISAWSSDVCSPDLTAQYACAFKPQIAHFAARGAEDALERLVAHIHATHPGIPVILDAKRGDIGSTAQHYATEAFDRYHADAVTANPYLGRDSVQ